MTSKRKRKRPGNAFEGGGKRQKVSNFVNGDGNNDSNGNATGRDSVVKQALLARYYARVYTLREYLLSKLPSTSKIRRKKIVCVGRGKSWDREAADQELSALLDQTLIGELVCKEGGREHRWRQWTAYSQRIDDSTSTFANVSSLSGVYSQSEIVDFAIWSLFSKGHARHGRVQHLLCQGFRKDVSSRAVNQGENHTSGIPGVVATHPNHHVATMKAPPWSQVLNLLGKEGERLMLDLILDCGIFVEVGKGCGIYHQLSGTPLGDLQTLLETRGEPLLEAKDVIDPEKHRPSSITFVRNRMLYARAALNAQGGVRFGLRHIHVLNRCLLEASGSSGSAEKPLMNKAELHAQTSTIRVLMYLFPRQFGLHNVFTSDVDARQTVQPFKDYTLREDEINVKYAGAPKIPKRLRGMPVALVKNLQIQHSRCPYKTLLEYYCPAIDISTHTTQPLSQDSINQSKSGGFKTQNMFSTATTIANGLETTVVPRKPSMMSFATPLAMVSAFCRAVLSQLIPKDFWGAGDMQLQNERVFLKNVDRFIELRRFESLSLHEVSQGIQISAIKWLQPPGCSDSKISKSDLAKRWEILYEFLYYLFDSLLIPLVRANFHVTESNVHRYRLFYFRHDIWRSLAEPAIATLKLTMFEEVKLEQARKLLESRRLGFSQVRLLPKEIGVRPIMNLRRRTMLKGSKMLLGSSINSVLAPVHQVFSYEKISRPDRLGSTLFSVGDLYTKLKEFKSRQQDSSKLLYFVKLDVQSAFDTIPQAAVIKLMSSLPSQSEYLIGKHMEIKPGENYREDLPGRAAAKPTRRWASIAKSADDLQTFTEHLQTDLAVGKKNTIFVENIVNQFRDTDELLHLLSEHVQRNMVKIGKKFYRQKEGIPQGSVLSSLLCNYFYADLEAQHLSFLQASDSLLLRLIDDFLLITTNRSHAKEFLQIMHDGVPTYGVRVNPDKTLVNFDATINNKKVTRLVGQGSFPYCGSFIDTKTLDIARDRERRKDLAIADSLTVEFSRMPGRSFHRKVLNAFKIQSHAMFLDTSFNSLATVLRNVYTAFVETATKMWTYARCLPVGKQPGKKVLIKTISDLMELAFVLMKSKVKNKKNIGYKCAVSKVQVEWLATNAFRTVLHKRQSKYGKVIEWLDVRIGALLMKEREACVRMRGIV